jgi:hypothetical protein
MHELRDREAHRLNTWEWDKWGFTADWEDGCTLSDIDGFYPHFAEVSSKFLIVEVKSWNGELPLPQVNYNSGQAKALRQLAKHPDFTVIWAFGDTATRNIYDYEVWSGAEPQKFVSDFKGFLKIWFQWARNN